MYFPLVGIPESIQKAMSPFKPIFCRKEGFLHILYYVTGLLLSPNKTLQGIHHQIVPTSPRKTSSRAMHKAVFEASWDNAQLLALHRKTISSDYQKNKGSSVISLDWTQSHHQKGPHIYGNTKSYDYVHSAYSLFQTLVTATVSNRKLVDGLATEVQLPSTQKEEIAYLMATQRESYEQMEQVSRRLSELLHHHKNNLAYKKRTEMVLELVQILEQEGHFPYSDYAFDNGVLTVELTQFIESKGKHWVSQIERNRKIYWKGEERRVDEVEKELIETSKESFRKIKVKLRNGGEKDFFAFTKVIRLKRYGEKRLVLVHEVEDLSDEGRYLLTDAKHWESGRILEVWSYRWSCELFHEFSKQATGLESSQVRKEEAVKRHFHLSCVAQSILQRVVCKESKSEKFEFAQGEKTLGQQCLHLARENLLNVLQLAKSLFSKGHSCEQVLDFLLPA